MLKGKAIVTTSNTYVINLCCYSFFFFVVFFSKLYIDMNKLLKNGNPFLNENSQ